MAKLSISEILKEARRRRVFRIAALYVVGAWVVIQGADLAFPALNIPERAIGYVWLGAILGFPIAIILGWRYDISGGRIVRTLKVDETVELSLRRSDYVILASLAVVVTVIVIKMGDEISESQPPDIDSNWVENVDPASIAVLPFVNMSPDPENSFFADGISEELLNGLAQVVGLRVPARTSSFSLRDQKLNIKQIGQKLNVAYVLEGSVRVAGEKLRITAQLIDSRSDTHRWSKTYDRSMTDIFTVQDSISNNVVAAMKDTLSLGEKLADPIGTTQDSEAYGHYLRARALLRNLERDDNMGTKIQEAIGYLKSATELDPAFSDGFIALAEAYFQLSSFHYHWYQPVEAEQAKALAEEMAKTAVAMAPNSSEALRASGMISDDPDAKEAAFRAAIKANPNNVAAYGDLLAVTLEKDYTKENLRLARKFHSLDPLNAESSDFVAFALVVEGNLKEASTYFRVASQLRSVGVGEHTEPGEEYLEFISRLPTKPLDLDLETHLHMHLQGECRDEYELSISDDAYTGDESAHLVSLPGSAGWCNTAGAAPVHAYRGKYIRLVGMVKARNLTEPATLWMRIDGPTMFFILGFDNGAPDFIEAPDTDWRPYELNLYVPSDAYVILYGGVLAGEGEMWMDDFRFEVADTPDFN